MKEIILYTYAWATVAGALGGIVTYNLANPSQPEYKASMYRATTITGRGQFRCQTGC